MQTFKIVLGMLAGIIVGCIGGFVVLMTVYALIPDLDVAPAFVVFVLLAAVLTGGVLGGWLTDRRTGKPRGLYD